MENTFGTKLKEARKTKQLTQKQLADKIGAKHNSISDWENDKNKPDPDTIELLCGVLEITPNYLLATSEDDFSPYEKLLIRKYRFISRHSPAGKETVDFILNREHSITEALLKQSNRIAELEAPIQTQKIFAMADYKQSFVDKTFEYHRSVSAGGGVFMMDDEGVDQVAIPLETPGADKCDYLIKISGNSMEPDYYDGEVALVSRIMPVRHGDVGIFVVDGKAYIKEYGDTELISRNPSSENIKISEYANIVCMGKVVGKIREEDMVRK